MALNHLALFTCSAIETAFNQLPTHVKQDYSRLKTLQGKVFCIELTELSFPLYLVFAKSLQALSRYDGDVAITLKTELSTLYHLKQGANLTELIKQDKLVIDGDTQLLQTFSHFVQHIEIDIGEPISRYLGDALTHKLLSTGKQLGQQAQQVFNKTLSHLGQLTTEEYRLAPHKIEYWHFRDNLESLSVDIDAIEMRIQQIRDKLPS